jgi:hypothetical protein
MGTVLTPILSATAGTSRSYNPGMAETYSWLPIEGDSLGRPLYARASYITNFSDMSINLSASELSIGAVTLKDNNSGLNADVVSVPGYGAGLQVLTQDLESTIDDITIGDKEGHFANVDPTLSALDVRIANATPLSAVVTSTVAISTIQTLPISGSVTVLNPVTQITTSQEPTQLDAFGRLRTSSPMTLFDSSHRYRDNNLWASLTAVGGTYAFNQNQGLIEMTVGALSGSSVIRETTKVFSYQPGKSLLVMNTFVMAPSTADLRQRVGYFGQDNGIYFQLDDGNIGLVKRSLVSGSIVDTVVLRSNWNGDKLDGTGPSGIVLDITKAQIFWMDIEWLGVGTVRTGFVINGQFIVCHSFHHANIIDSTYITTASLPLRYEITNKAATSGPRTMKQICSTVISEGGYELRGLQQAVSIPINAARTFAAANTYYPIISIKLRTDRLDAIVILTALSILGDGDKKNYNWQVIASGTTTGGLWLSAGADSAVQYNITGDSFAGGRILASGYVSSNNASSPNVDILKEALFKFQLERNYFTSTPYELTLVAAINDTGGAGGTGMWASMDWEEISR